MAFKTKYPNGRHNFDRTRPVARLYALGEQDTFYGEKIFVFIICLKQFFWAQQNLGE